MCRLAFACAVETRVRIRYLGLGLELRMLGLGSDSRVRVRELGVRGIHLSGAQQPAPACMRTCVRGGMGHTGMNACIDR